MQCLGGFLIMKNLHLNEYVTKKQFNKMGLKERINIVNSMLQEYDLKVINNHLGIDVDYLFWLFRYAL